MAFQLKTFLGDQFEESFEFTRSLREDRPFRTVLLLLMLQRFLSYNKEEGRNEIIRAGQPAAC